MTSLVKVIVEQSLGAGVQRDIACLVTFAVNPQVGHAAAGVDVLDFQTADASERVECRSNCRHLMFYRRSKSVIKRRALKCSIVPRKQSTQKALPS